jgi:putative transcriptional regulator
MIFIALCLAIGCFTYGATVLYYLKAGDNELDNNIAKLRSKQKLSQQELADAIGVSRKTISTVEVGRFIPSVEIALKMARYSQVSVEKIFVLE